MEKLTALLLILSLLSCCGTAAAEGFRFTQPMMVRIIGEEIKIHIERNGASGAYPLLLLGEDGTVLAEDTVLASRKSYSFVPDESVPLTPMQTITLATRLEDGSMEPLDTAVLFTDTAHHSCISTVECEEKKIAITFDTANGIGRIDTLLQLLEKYGARCTFFLQGKFIENFPEETARIYQAGHELANHSTNHPDMRKISVDKIYREIQTTNDLITQITGKPVRLYRPPSGIHTERDRAVSRALGNEPIFWTFDSLDGFKASSRSQVWLRMTTQSQKGAIILMHIYGQYTVSVLEEYLPMMQAEGYEFVTVSELLSCGTPIDQIGNRYNPFPAAE